MRRLLKMSARRSTRSYRVSPAAPARLRVCCCWRWLHPRPYAQRSGCGPAPSTVPRMAYSARLRVLGGHIGTGASCSGASDPPAQTVGLLKCLHSAHPFFEFF